MEKNHLLRIIKDENHCRETSDGKRKKTSSKRKLCNDTVRGREYENETFHRKLRIEKLS